MESFKINSIAPLFLTRVSFAITSLCVHHPKIVHWNFCDENSFTRVSVSQLTWDILPNKN